MLNDDYIASRYLGKSCPALSWKSVVNRASISVYRAVARCAFTDAPTVEWDIAYLCERHQDAQTNLKGIAAQTFEQRLVRIGSMLCGVIGKLDEQRSVAVHGPEPPRTIDSLPNVRGSGLDTATIEITLGDIIESPVVGPECRNDLIPAALLALRLRAAPKPTKTSRDTASRIWNRENVVIGDQCSE